ncbi:MAG: type II secretion system protein [Thiobacillus sp.]
MNKDYKFHRMTGFTMIELIVVIVILGVLSAVALPRFTNVQRDARIAKLNAARGAVQSAAALIHGTALARGGVADTIACPGGGTGPNPANNVANICTESGRLTMINAYPTANLNGIINAAGLTTTFPATAAALTAEGYSTTGGGGAAGAVLTVRVNGGSAVANCSFTYTAPAANAAPTVSTIVTTGC